MRTAAILCAVTVTFVAVSPAPAEAPERPSGNLGGGALVAPPKDIFGAGNAVIGMRALADRKLEIEATLRGKCTGGDITTDATIAADGTFSAEGKGTQEPNEGEKVTTAYKISGTFTSASAAEGTLSATLEKSDAGRTARCKTGTVTFSARRPDGRIGKRGAERRARYFGTTAQRGVGPRRPIVLRVSASGKRLSRALFGEQVKCSDSTRSIGIEAPRTNLTIASNGRVKDNEKYTIDNGDTRTFVEDSFTAVLGRSGAKGTFSLSDRTIDKATGNIIQTCESGEIKWTAAP